MKQKPNGNKFLNVSLALVLILLGTTFATEFHSNGIKDVYSEVVKLSSEKGMCSGESIKGKSGVNYILTAAHCKILAKDGSIKIITADNRELQRKIIEIDEHADLMLLEGVPNLDTLDIASEVHSMQNIETFTHGHNFPTYKTNGVIIANAPVEFILNVIASPEEETACRGGPLKIVVDSSLFGEIKYCVFSSIETATTALIVPGSSGGPVVNDRHELVGVVSAGDEHFGYLVRLIDIKNFLANY